MTLYGRIENGKLVEVADIEGDIEGRFHPSLNWQSLGGLVPTPEAGWTFAGGIFSPPTARPLADLQADAKAEVDRSAEATRLLWITPGAGQALTYQAKLAEAQAHAAFGAGPFPLLEASVGIEAPTLADVAALVLGRNAAWTTIGAEIETQRLGAKAAIAAASDAAGIDAALAAIEWPAP